MSDSIVGIWSLSSVEFHSGRGEVVHPFGPHPVGQMIASRDGHFAIQVMDPRRPQFASGDVFGATLEEKASAMRGFTAYSGTYEAQGDRILIHIRASLFPNWVGKDEVRSFTLKGDELEIRTKPILAGGSEVSATLIWKRVSRLT
jgi:Lipocalin-like domain